MRAAAFLFSFLFLLLGSNFSASAAHHPHGDLASVYKSQEQAAKLQRSLTFQAPFVADFSYIERDGDLYYEEVEEDGSNDGGAKKHKSQAAVFSAPVCQLAFDCHYYTTTSSSSQWQTHTPKYILQRTLRI